MRQTVTFPSGTVEYMFQHSFAEYLAGCDRERTVLVTDEHILHLYPQLFKGHKTLVLPPGESSKSLETIGRLTKELIALEATRKTTLIGVGGGVVTDITGLLASVYMRGVPFGFVPTTLLAMVDAAVGGKNGVNAGLNKNIIGTISQPAFILFDAGFLDTLPDEEWSNGFAEIIKYACIFDTDMFAELEKNSISAYRTHGNAELDALIERCVTWKNRTVTEDEHEQGVRKLLNFGHTAAHAIENLYELSHGKAVAIGMVIACMLSEQETGLDKSVAVRLKELSGKYGLPVRHDINVKQVMAILKMDKKRVNDTIDYILLERVGKAVVKSLPFAEIEHTLAQI